MGPLQSLGRLLRMSVSALAALRHYSLCPAESGLTTKSSSNSIKNSQGPRVSPSAELGVRLFLLGSLPACCPVPSAEAFSSLTRGWAEAHAGMLQRVKCNFATVTPKNCCVRGALRVLSKMKLKDGWLIHSFAQLLQRILSQAQREQSGDLSCLWD